MLSCSPHRDVGWWPYLFPPWATPLPPCAKPIPPYAKPLPPYATLLLACATPREQEWICRPKKRASWRSSAPSPALQTAISHWIRVMGFQPPFKFTCPPPLFAFSMFWLPQKGSRSVWCNCAGLPSVVAEHILWLAKLRGWTTAGDRHWRVPQPTGTFGLPLLCLHPCLLEPLLIPVMMSKSPSMPMNEIPELSCA